MRSAHKPVHGGRGDCTKHASQSVAAETLLQNTSQLGITVGDELRLGAFALLWGKDSKTRHNSKYKEYLTLIEGTVIANNR